MTTPLIRRLPLVLAGFGRVGKAFCALLQEKRAVLLERYGLDLGLRAVLKSDGGFMAETDLSESALSEILAGQAGGQSPWRRGLTVESALRIIEPGILVECTPSNLETGEPGLRHIQIALSSGWHVVTANKGPLVVASARLLGLAREKGLSLRFSGATSAALPALDVGLVSLAGTDIISIEGILNGTSNFILTRMGEGATLEDALADAQAKGISEPDPTLDVEGWDTAAKLLLIANSVLGQGLVLGDIKVEGISGISPSQVSAAKREGKSLKLIGKASRGEANWRAAVSPVPLDPEHPLFHVVGTDKGVTFLTDTMGAVTVTGGKSDPRGAAAALLKDIIHTLVPLP